MEIVVLAKYVPNPQGVPDLGPDGLVIREEVEGGLDPTDEYGVEAALQLAEAHGGRVTVVSMGPEVAVTGVRRALAMGADEAVLVTDPVLRGADALVTARVLSAAVRRRPFDVVIAGTESTDGCTGTLPVAVAELLGVPSLTFARKLEIQDGQARIERQTPDGYDIVDCALPVLVTVTSGVAEPRYPTMKGIMGAKKKALERPDVAGLGLSPEQVTWTQRICSVEDAPARGGGETIEFDEETAARVVDLLEKAKVV